MGIVSGAALNAGGDVVGVIPHAMLAVGSEGERVSTEGTPSVCINLGEEGREMVGVISFCDIPITESGLRWNGCEWLPWLPTIPTFADFCIGRCEFDARA